MKAIESIGLGVSQLLFLVCLGGTYVLANRLDDALELAERALTLERERGGRGWEAYARRLLGEIASHPDPPDVEAAEAHYRQAMALGDEPGMRPLVARSHLGLGTLYRRTATRRQAQEHLATAMTMFREMDMRFWLDKAEAEIRALG